MIDPSSSQPRNERDGRVSRQCRCGITVQHVHGVQSVVTFFEMNEGVVFQLFHAFDGLGFELFEDVAYLFFCCVHHQISHVENANLNTSNETLLDERRCQTNIHIGHNVFVDLVFRLGPIDGYLLSP
jgi:hypothetical protein